jgi:hypothetical protein
MKMPGTSGGTGVAPTSFFSVTPNLIVEHFQGCGLLFARKSRSVTRRTLCHNHPYPDFDVTGNAGVTLLTSKHPMA